MSATEGEFEVKLLAVVLQGEDNYWFAEPRISKPLEGNWLHVDCFWLYPVESGVAQFVDLKDFDLTDSVFELDTQGVSKVLRSATLSSDVVAKKYHQGRRTYYFITQKEINRMDLCYNALLKKEAEVLPLLRQQDEGVRDEVNRIEAGAPADYNGEKKTNTLKDTRLGGNEEETTGVFGANAISQDYRHSHQRRTPYQGTSVYIAPTVSKPMGDHCSSEAFRWNRYYIIHRGSVDYLVPEPTGNTYGFRLDKVTHDGFPVFLLFEGNVKDSYKVEPSANAVPAMEFAYLKGGGGETEYVGNRVLVLTRPRGSHKRVRKAADVTQRVSRRLSPPPSPVSSASDDESDRGRAAPLPFSAPQSALPPPAAPPRRGRGRPRKVPLPPPPPPAKDEAPPPGERSKPGGAPPEPLQACSVDVWTDWAGAVPPPAQLAAQFPFLHTPSASLRTTVFPDGTCVTYASDTAEEFLKPSDAKKNSNAGAPLASSGGGGAPVDDDMRSLLEHIQLAKLQLNA